MPLYEYRCETCDEVFSELRCMSDREAPIECPHCGGAGKVQISSFAQGSSESSQAGDACAPGGL